MTAGRPARDHKRRSVLLRLEPGVLAALDATPGDRHGKIVAAIEAKHMVYIENDGALFRGPARSLPTEVWAPSQGKFVPYNGGPKGIEWGEIIGEAEAKEMMAETE